MRIRDTWSIIYIIIHFRVLKLLMQFFCSLSHPNVKYASVVFRHSLIVYMIAIIIWFFYPKTNRGWSPARQESRKKEKSSQKLCKIHTTSAIENGAEKLLVIFAKVHSANAFRTQWFRQMRVDCPRSITWNSILNSNYYTVVFSTSFFFNIIKAMCHIFHTNNHITCRLSARWQMITIVNEICITQHPPYRRVSHHLTKKKNRF